jgi:hypothetical protein
MRPIAALPYRAPARPARWGVADGGRWIVSGVPTAHLVNIPMLHDGGPLAVLGCCFLMAFFIDETGAGLRHLYDCLRRPLRRWWT